MAALETIFNREIWASVPFHFWSVVFFVLGAMVGSLLNVCIHRMPLGLSIVHPRSHCPHCKYSIPWFLNLPLVTWVALRAKCANCGSPISVRYFLVELLTGAAFLSSWLTLGRSAPALALVYCIILSGFIVAVFIDFEHLIIPDEITIGGIVVGFFCSAAVPLLHNTTERAIALRSSFLGIVIGGGLVYLILRGGKLMFGREKLKLPGETKIIFTETSLQLPDKEIPFEELFYRKSDFIQLWAKTVELSDRCYFNTPVKLTPSELTIGADKFNPEEVPHMEVVTSELILPREAMGFGDVKFMAAIGAFLGWPAVIFSLMSSAVLGSVVGITAIVLGRKEWSSRIPYGPYIAAAAVVWMFMPRALQLAFRDYMAVLKAIFTGDPFP
jgi:leader peptidase (prepilin peptidase)/N-methyltransferase